MTTKPIDLIVANCMHDAVGALKTIDSLTKAITAVVPQHAAPQLDLDAEIARKLLCMISHDASMEMVFKALASVGAPASKTDIRDGIQAVKDRQ